MKSTLVALLLLSVVLAGCVVDAGGGYYGHRGYGWGGYGHGEFHDSGR